MTGRNTKGLLGFIIDIGTELEGNLKSRFRDRIESHRIDIDFNYNNSQNYGVMIWGFSGRDYNFLGKFSIEQEDEEDPKLIIDRIPGVKIYPNSNRAEPRADSKELRLAADMEENVTQFLDKRFGQSTRTRGNGCPIYETTLPTQYIEPLEEITVEE